MRFIADAMVADLARWLRILGEDCQWVPPEWSDGMVLQVAREDDRVLVTRDDQLVERSRAAGVRGVRVPQGDPVEALAQVYKATGLRPLESRLATRCSMCNGRLVPVDGQAAVRRAERAGVQPPLPEVLERHSVFWSCSSCQKAFWRGTHWDQIDRVRCRVLTRLGPD